MEILYDTRAIEHMALIPAKDLERIRKAIEMKLTRYPELFGVRLRGTLKDYWKLRVGDYRVGYKIQKNTVIIFGIGNRKDFYRNFERGVR